METECIICGYPIQEVLIIDGVKIELCDFHAAEYHYKPDDFLRRHGLLKRKEKVVYGQAAEKEYFRKSNKLCGQSLEEIEERNVNTRSLSKF